jgi:hypothetical protein
MEPHQISKRDLTHEQLERYWALLIMGPDSFSHCKNRCTAECKKIIDPPSVLIFIYAFNLKVLVSYELSGLWYIHLSNMLT